MSAVTERRRIILGGGAAAVESKGAEVISRAKAGDQASLPQSEDAKVVLESQLLATRRGLEKLCSRPALTSDPLLGLGRRTQATFLLSSVLLPLHLAGLNRRALADAAVMRPLILPHLG